MEANEVGNPDVTFSWHVEPQELIESNESGRWFAIIPDKIRISNGWTGRRDTRVFIEGNRVHRDGTRGGRKAVIYELVPWSGSSDRSLSQLPGWAAVYLSEWEAR